MTSRKTVVVALGVLTIWTIHSFGMIGYTSYAEVKKYVSNQVPSNETTCSERSYKRGDGQRVFAFSFYGSVTSNLSQAKGYFEGIKGNMEIITKHYPGYVMRLYFDLVSEHPILHELKDLQKVHHNLDICDVNTLPGTRLANATKMFPMVWRFFPTLDPQVKI